MYLPYANRSTHANDETVVSDNRSSTKLQTMYGLLNSGTTDHFLALNSICMNKHKTKNPIKITIPNGSQIQSTHECEINWQNIHIVPALHDKALISVVKLCAHGRDFAFCHHCCLVLYKGKIALYGIKYLNTNLWLVPLSEQKNVARMNWSNTKYTK